LVVSREPLIRLGKDANGDLIILMRLGVADAAVVNVKVV